MDIKFLYKCRVCTKFFEDPSLPSLEAKNQFEVESILRDSLRQNPTAKKRAAINESHLCGIDEKTIPTVGVGDLVGYRLYGDLPKSAPEPAKTLLKLVPNPDL